MIVEAAAQLPPAKGRALLRAVVAKDATATSPVENLPELMAGSAAALEESIYLAVMAGFEEGLGGETEDAKTQDTR